MQSRTAYVPYLGAILIGGGGAKVVLYVTGWEAGPCPASVAALIRYLHTTQTDLDQQKDLFINNNTRFAL